MANGCVAVHTANSSGTGGRRYKQVAGIQDGQNKAVRYSKGECLGGKGTEEAGGAVCAISCPLSNLPTLLGCVPAKLLAQIQGDQLGATEACTGVRSKSSLTLSRLPVCPSTGYNARADLGGGREGVSGQGSSGWEGSWPKAGSGAGMWPSKLPSPGLRATIWAVQCPRFCTY